MATFTWKPAGSFPDLWTDPFNWQVANATTTLFPGTTPADVAIVNDSGAPNGSDFPFITGGAAITLASLSATGTAHVIVGTGQLGGLPGGGILNAGTISQAVLARLLNDPGNHRLTKAWLPSSDLPECQSRRRA